jgi:hypothetical protein
MKLRDRVMALFTEDRKELALFLMFGSIWARRRAEEMIREAEAEKRASEAVEVRK